MGQQIHTRFSETTLSPPVLPVCLDGTYPKLQDAQQHSVGEELGIVAMAYSHTSYDFSGAGAMRPLVVPASGMPSRFDNASGQPVGMGFINPSFISQPVGDVMNFPPLQSPYSGTRQSSVDFVPEENYEWTWCPDSREELTCPDKITTTGENQMQSKCNLISDSLIGPGGWIDLPDMIPDPLNDWLYAPNADPTPHQQETMQANQTIPQNCCQPGIVRNSSAPSTAEPSKQRMRWTTELHDCFLDAVNQLGEKATPKGVLRLMKVEGLTISHVKSHLQKWRSVRYRPASTQETPENTTPAEDIPAVNQNKEYMLTDALRAQMELQKKLHEQLEIQRELQLRLEEQGRYLQMVIEQQQKAGGETQNQAVDVGCPVKISEGSCSEQGNGSTISATSRRFNKQKVLKSEPCPESPPHKRAKGHNNSRMELDRRR